MRFAGGSAFAIAGLAALAATSACRPDAPAPSGRQALVKAVSTTLPFPGRLSGGFEPSNVAPTRAAGDRAAALSPDTRIAIALLEKRATEARTPGALADLGVGYLIQGEIDRAITTIADAASQMSVPQPWSDLSAAYLVKAERTPTRRVEYLARALEAAEQSLRVAPTNDALFNRTLARDGLAPFTGSPAPWPEYLEKETDPAWRAAAAHEATNDRAVDDVRDQWDARRKALAVKLQAGDTAFVEETVRLYPEASIEFLEQELLVRHDAIASAVTLASAIHKVTRDPMMRDEVAAMTVAGPPLAEAHRQYVLGLEQSNANKISAARTFFQQALLGFTKASAPYRAWAVTRLAYLDWQEREYDGAQRSLARIEVEGRRRGYNTLLGRVLWQRGMAFNRQWRLAEALDAFRESALRYETAGEHEYAVSMYSNLADALRMLGEANQSSEYIDRALRDAHRVRSAPRRYLLLYNASLFARRENLNGAALLFQDAAVREAAKINTRVLTEATIQRALVNIRRGDTVEARADLDQVARYLESVTEESFRAYQTAELNIARAQLPTEQDRAVEHLRNAIAFFSGAEPGRVPSLYLMMARSPQARTSRSAAEGALRSGIESLEAQQAGLGDEALRISYFDESWALFQDMVAWQVAAKDSGKAFEYAERSRARSLLATAQGTATSRTRLLPDIQAELPKAVVMLHYSTLADRLLIWTITASTATFVERPIAERDLARLVEQHRSAIRDHRDDEAVNDRLYALLIEPAKPALAAGQVLALVPDGQLQQLAFATLRDPASKRYLIEDHAVVVSPSASFFVDARVAQRRRATSPVASALLIGNPTADSERGLPGAEAEVQIAAKLYPQREVLTGRSATKERFLNRAPQFDVVHFGGHAVVNPEFPLLSRLVFADQAESEQSLFAHEIGRVRFPRTRVVVLAACSTAAGVVSRGEGVVSVARPFLGGGVPLVIASQWDVDDRATEQLTKAFHSQLATSGDPIQALQNAQLALLRSGDPVQALPANWGAFIAVGTILR